MSPSVGEVVKAKVVTTVLARLGKPPDRASRRRRPRRGKAVPAPEPGPLVPLMFGLLGVALVTMLVFEATITRVVGVVCIFAFIVTGVFAIARHDFLDPEVDDRTGNGGGR